MIVFIYQIVGTHYSSATQLRLGNRWLSGKRTEGSAKPRLLGWGLRKISV